LHAVPLFCPTSVKRQPGVGARAWRGDCGANFPAPPGSSAPPRHSAPPQQPQGPKRSCAGAKCSRIPGDTRPSGVRPALRAPHQASSTWSQRWAAGGWRAVGRGGGGSRLLGSWRLPAPWHSQGAASSARKSRRAPTEQGPCVFCDFAIAWRAAAALCATLCARWTSVAGAFSSHAGRSRVRGLFVGTFGVPGAAGNLRMRVERMLCDTAARSDGRLSAALAIAELSTTEAIAACASCLLCRGLFSWEVVVPMRDRDAWAQRRCSAGRVLCAQLPPDSQV